MRERGVLLAIVFPFMFLGIICVAAYSDGHPLLHEATNRLDAYGNVYYVSPSGDDNNPGTISQPFKTIQKAADIVNPGDAVNVKAGIYNEAVVLKRSGLIGSPITFQGERGSSGEWLTVIDPSIDASSGWEEAPEVGFGVYKKKFGFRPELLTVDGKTVMSIDVDLMDPDYRIKSPAGYSGINNAIRILFNDNSDKNYTGFDILKQPSNKLLFTDSKKEFYMWDVVKAMYGYHPDGYTYLRFNEGDDPNGKNIRVYYNGNSEFVPVNPGIKMERVNNTIIRNFKIMGTHDQISLRYKESNNNIIENNYMEGGYSRVSIRDDSHHNQIRNNTMTLNLYSDFIPGAWGSNDTYENRIKNMIYYFFKMISGSSSSHDAGVLLNSAGDGNEIYDNFIFNGLIGVDLYGPINKNPFRGTKVYRNLIENMSSCGVVLDRGNTETEVYENLLVNSNINLRIHEVNWGEKDRISYIYRNRMINPPYTGSHVYVHFQYNGTPSNINTWFYHNSLLGARNGFSISPWAEHNGGLPNTWIMNNIISCRAWVSSPLLNDSSFLNTFDYNYLSSTANINGAWIGENNIKFTDRDYIWDLSDRELLIGKESKAYNSAIDLSKTFVLGGNSYPALLGMSSALDGSPDMGYYEINDYDEIFNNYAFYLDVGSPEDSNKNSKSYLSEISYLSPRGSEGGKSYRTLSEGGYFDFFINSSGFPLSENGVPYRDAIMTVTYKDVIDQDNCNRPYSWISCTPYILTRINYSIISHLQTDCLGGLNDLSWKNTTIFFENNSWQILRSIDGLFQFRVYYPKQISPGTPLPIDSVELRFMDSEQFYSIIESDRKSRGLIREDYQPTNSFNVKSINKNYIIFSRNYMESIYQNTIPEEKDLTSEVSTFEIDGNYEPVTFSVYSIEDLYGLEVKVGDLRSGSNVISKGNLKVEKVVYIDRRWGSVNKAYYGNMPVYLSDFASVDLAKGKTQQFWITVYVPKGTPKGIYEGSIEITGRNMASSSLSLKVEVFNIDLAEPDAPSYLWHSPFSTYKYSYPREVAADDMARHDIVPISYFSPKILPGGDLDLSDPIWEHQFNYLKGKGILPSKIPIGFSSSVTERWNALCNGIPIFEEICIGFDEEYKKALINVKKHFEKFGTEPIFTFEDEPGGGRAARLHASYLNRLVKEAGMETWVTYYVTCEKPLAGYNITFNKDKNSIIQPKDFPSFLRNDKSLVGYWDFEGDILDKSGNNNHGTFYGNARAENGVLMMDGGGIMVKHNESLNLKDSATIMFWIKPDAYTEYYAIHPIRKWSSTNNANYVFYYFGNYYGNLTKDEGNVGFFANVDGRWGMASGLVKIDDLSKKHQVIWTYKKSDGGVIYLNGEPYFNTALNGELATNNVSLYIGGIKGYMDEVMIFNRTFSYKEVFEDVMGKGPEANEFILSTKVLSSEEIPKTISFSLDYGDVSNPWGGSFDSFKKSLYVNGNEVWRESYIDNSYPSFNVDISGHVIKGSENEITFRIENMYSSSQSFLVYFIDDFWRNRGWEISKSSEEWSYKHIPDKSGALGPMDKYLDHRVYFNSIISEKEYQKTLASGDYYSYYTTYPATTPVILYNRFLNGIYPSALNISSVYVYAYGDWGGYSPYDEMLHKYRDGIKKASELQGGSSYNLIFPSWEPRVYNMLIYESMREGIEDSRIIATLKEKIANSNSGKSKEAESYLAELFSKPSKSYREYYWVSKDSSLPIQERWDLSDVILANLSGSPDNYHFFDETRRKMINYILELSEGCTEGCGSGEKEAPMEPEPEKEIPQKSPPTPPGGASRECSPGQTKQCGSSIGECKQGIQNCVNGQWGSCTGQVGPSEEVCDGLDNNCNGQIDENCLCVEGQNKPCGSNIGICKQGVQSCVSGQWGACIGNTPPLSQDICFNYLDDNCNGEVDEGCEEAIDTCSNGRLDSGEQGTDCGGKCPKKCPDLELISVLMILVGLFGMIGTTVYFGYIK